MCLGVPAQVVAISQPERGTAWIELEGVRREVNVQLVAEPEAPLSGLIGQWVVVHAGFAISVLDEEEAARSLALFAEWQARDDA